MPSHTDGRCVQLCDHVREEQVDAEKSLPALNEGHLIVNALRSHVVQASDESRQRFEFRSEQFIRRALLKVLYAELMQAI